jgi:phosphoribosylglycinamide formyltransferase 1
VISNNIHAKVLDKAKNHDIATYTFNKEELQNGNVLAILQNLNPDLIVLAGFLLKFPESIIYHFENKVINIHPALLPKYGGKGMYGMNIHHKVFDHKEIESGITIHYVNEHYDEGEFILQKKVNVENCNSAEEIAQKVLELEHKHFPEVIDQLLVNQQ